MAQLASISALLNKAAGADSGAPERIFYEKCIHIAGGTGTLNVSPGIWSSCWERSGYTPFGAGPGTTVRIPDNTTAGGMLQTDPGSGKDKRLIRAIWGGQANVGMIRLYDRLLDVSGFSGTDTGSQTVGGTITRYTDGAGTELYAEIYANIGSTPQTLTATYTNQAGTGSRSATCIVGGATANCKNRSDMLKFQLQSGDTGVRSVQSVQLGGSTGTAGDYGVTLIYPLAVSACVSANRGHQINFLDEPGGPPVVKTDACLAVMLVAHTATNFRIHGHLFFEDA